VDAPSTLHTSDEQKEEDPGHRDKPPKPIQNPANILQTSFIHFESLSNAEFQGFMNYLSSRVRAAGHQYAMDVLTMSESTRIAFITHLFGEVVSSAFVVYEQELTDALIDALYTILGSRKVSLWLKSRDARVS
jgi:hypothetical protein